ncbi:MAG: hypothetical protein EBT78_18565 [Betaproteobacteria bacterium]|nr:hypothetical protein [Betaproteobacteria bacterium]
MHMLVACNFAQFKPHSLMNTAPSRGPKFALVTGGNFYEFFLHQAVVGLFLQQHAICRNSNHQITR